jgi:amino acid permease
MKRAAAYGIGATTIFYISVGCAGYAAFDSNAPGNILTAAGLGPFWLVDIANMCLILHLIGAYQVSRRIFNCPDSELFFSRNGTQVKLNHAISAP